MSIQGVVFQNQRVSAEDHAALFQMFISDGIIAGCGISSVRNTLTVSSGVFVLAGRLIKIVGSQQITIPDTIVSTTVRLTGVIDLTQIATAEEFGQFSYRIDQLTNGSYPELRKENINTGNGNYYEVEWARITVDGQSNITNLDVKIGISQGTTPGGNNLTLDDFEFPAGSYQFEVDGDNWELAFTNSGEFKLKKDLTGVDIFIIGAGFNGTTSVKRTGGTNHDGGDGGYYTTYFGDTLKAGSHTVVIGSTNGAASSLDTKSVSEENSYIFGGLGADVTNVWSPKNGSNGSSGVYAFNDQNTIINRGRQYGASGGGGAARGYASDHEGIGGPGAGASYGSGAGGKISATASERNGGNALANSGSGGGGRSVGYWDGNQTLNGNPGLGGSGIIILRNSRTSE